MAKEPCLEEREKAKSAENAWNESIEKLADANDYYETAWIYMEQAIASKDESEQQKAAADFFAAMECVEMRKKKMKSKAKKATLYEEVFEECADEHKWYYDK